MERPKLGRGVVAFRVPTRTPARIRMAEKLCQRQAEMSEHYRTCEDPHCQQCIAADR